MSTSPSTAPAPPPPSSAPPPTQPSSPPPPPPGPPPPQSNPTPPTVSPPPSQSPPPIATSPAPQSSSTQPPSPPPPPIATSPPPAKQPPMATPPTTVSPPPQSPASPPLSSSSPPSSNSPASSPPPSSSVPATTPPPPPPVSSLPPRPASSPPPPPASSPPPPSITPTSSPPPPPPNTSPPPPSRNPSPTRSPPPPTSSPPPPSSDPPASSPSPSVPPRSPPPPASPEISPPPPSTQAPINSPPPPENSPPPPVSKSPSHSSPPPPPAGEPASNPPPPLASAPSSNSTSSRVLNPPPSSPPAPVPPGAPTTNSSNSNAPDRSGSTGGKGIGTTEIVAIGVVVGLILLSVIGTAAWCVWKRKKKASGPNGGHILPTSVGSSSPKSDSGLLKVGKSSANTAISSRNDFVYSPVEPGGLGNSRSLFTFDELMAATEGFSAHNLLGEGGFGSVYKGHLLDGREVAVKQLKIGGGQGEREFRAEVETISRIHHRHLVSLVGYCISDNRRLLIYDYVPNNTLYFHLHGQGRPVMNWAMRVRIAVGAARGLAYLHEDCHPRIIHRDIKSSNILLDSNFEARVSDFGLAKICQDSNTHISTRVMGTFGYMAPEYASSGKLTDKSDVFSFGVVLMELITGRKPVDSSQPLGEESLVEWGRPLLSHAIETEEFDELVDPRLEKNYVDSEMLLLIEVAAACVRHSSAKRPQMGQVVRAFDSLATYDLTNGMRVGESEIFNSAQQSEEIRWFRRMAFGGSQDYSTDFFSQGSYR